MTARRSRPGRAILAVSLLAGAFAATPAQAAHSSYNHTLTSKAPDAIDIVATVFMPDGASASTPVPMVLHSHGWAGGRSTSGFTAWLDAGFGVLSFDQRGHGASGGQANVEDPELEGKDIETVIDYVASLDWVAKEALDDETFGTDDPWLFAIGGSYGGGYQTIGALTETRNFGRTRFDALAPEITWHDLPNSLGPEGPVRALWVSLLYAVGAPMVPDYIHESFVVGAATGWFPDGTIPGTTNVKAEFLEHSPKGFSDNGFFLDIPVVFGQGVTDNLFNLNQGINNFLDVLTPAAQEDSVLIGYNGGHVLPEVYPRAINPSGDPCSGAGGFSAVSRSFFGKVYAGADPSTVQPNTFNIASNDNTCVRTDDITTRTVYPVGLADGVDAIASVAAPAGPVQHVKIADGPLTVAGIAKLKGTLTTVGADARAFFGLSVGTSPTDAAVVANNVLPLRRLVPAVQEPLSFDLPGSSIVVGDGESLYLTVSTIASAFVGYGSRTPGVVVITDPVVELPVVS
jgi:pimeloyl-ACP methyl ester carboxylesterase